MTTLDGLTQVPPPRQPRGGPGFHIAIGILVGVLLMALISPRTVERPTAAISRGSAAESGSASGADGGLVGVNDTTAIGGDTVPIGGQAPVGIGGGPTRSPASRRSADAATVSTALANCTAVNNGGATARGVTADSIKVGVAYVDLSQFQYLGKKFDQGDPEKQWHSIEEAWKRDGVRPCGRTVHFVLRKYSPVDTNQERATCVDLIQTEKVFMIVGPHDYPTGGACVTREFQTPLITSQGESDESMSLASPWLFQSLATESRTFRNVVRWAEARGFLKGRKIGIYHSNDATWQKVIDSSFKAELAKLGYKVAVEATTDSGPPDREFASQNDGLAVQRFRSGGVDLAYVFVNAVAKLGFVQAAEQQGYRPQYIESDVFGGTFDGTTDNFPPAQYEGVYGITSTRSGESAVGIPNNAQFEKCATDYEKAYPGETVERPGPNGHSGSMVAVLELECVQAALMLHGVNAAGPALTASRFVKGLETVKDFENGSYSALSFAAGQHGGTNLQRTVQWHTDCACYRAIGQFAPLYVK